MLGDGLTQHSPVGVDHLYSLAAALIKERDLPALTEEGKERQDEFIRAVASTADRSAGDEAIEFAAGLVFKESDREYGQARYYSCASAR